MSPESIRAELLKAQRINELDRLTRERLFMAKDKGQSGSPGTIITRDYQSDQAIFEIRPVFAETENVAQTKAAEKRDP